MSYSERTGSVLAGVGLVGFLAGGCSSPAPEVPCAVYSMTGEKVLPSTYPLGKVAVGFQPWDSVGQYNGPFTTVYGTIESTAGAFALRAKDLPERGAFGELYSISRAFNNTGVVLTFATAETGRLGITSGCINKSVDPENGLQESVVNLPTLEVAN